MTRQPVLVKAARPGLWQRLAAWHINRLYRRERIRLAAQRSWQSAALAHTHIPVEMTDHNLPVKPAQSPDDDRQHNDHDDHDQHVDQPPRNPAHHAGKLPARRGTTP